MVDHVLVAMGRKEESENALEYALEEYPDAKISVIHVMAIDGLLNRSENRDPGVYLVPECDFELEDELLPNSKTFSRAQRKRAERVFERACNISDLYGEEINPVVKSGEAVEEIVKYAEEHTVNQIVIGHHEPTEFRPILRSVPESVARNTSLPVTIV